MRHALLYILFKRRSIIVKRVKKVIGYIVTLYVYDSESNELIQYASVSVYRNGVGEYYNTVDKGYVTFSVNQNEVVEINVKKAGYIPDKLILIITDELNEKYTVKITALDHNTNDTIPNAHVVISGDSESYEGYTDENGIYTVTLNKNVEYTVKIEADGYDYSDIFKLIVV